MSYMTYKLFLTNISTVFGAVRMPWNKHYDKVRAESLLTHGVCVCSMCVFVALHMWLCVYAPAGWSV